MSVTDQDFKEISEAVYKVDSDAGNLDKGKIIETTNNKYQILEVEDNPLNGMQAMAVAPVDHNGNVDASEVVVAFAGTDSSDQNDLNADFQGVGLGSAHQSINIDEVGPEGVAAAIEQGYNFLPDPVVGGYWTDAQYVTGKEFADKVAAKYPDSLITTTGHSLGEFIALYVSAENQWLNFGFNGPDPYENLSPEGKAWLADNPGMQINARNRGDNFVGNQMGDGTGAEVKISLEMGLRHLLDYHDLAAWLFTDLGELEIKDNGYNEEAMELYKARKAIRDEIRRKHKLSYPLNVEIRKNKNKLLKLEKKFQASGGISKNEQIYLDDSLALFTLQSGYATLKEALLDLKYHYMRGSDNVEQTWFENVHGAKPSFPDLTESEFQAVLESSGYTEAEIVTKTQEIFDQEIQKIEGLKGSFEALIKNVETSINNLVEKDKELGQQLRS